MKIGKYLLILFLFLTPDFYTEALAKDLPKKSSEGETLTLSPKPVPLLIETNKKKNRRKDQAFVFNPDTFFEFLGQHSNSFLKPGFFQTNVKTFHSFFSKLYQSFRKFYPKVQNLGIFIGLALFSFLMTCVIRWIIIRQLRKTKFNLPLSYLRRVALILIDFFLTGILPASVFLFSFIFFKNTNTALKSNDFFLLLQFSAQVLFVFFLIMSFSRNIFSPVFEPKRLLSLRNESALKLYRELTWLFTLFFTDLALSSFISKNKNFLPISDISAPLFNLMKSYFLWRLSNPFLWKNGKLVSEERKSFWLGITFLTRTAILLVVGATLFGYNVFGSFVINRLIITGCTSALMLFVYLTMKEVLLFILRTHLHPKSDKELFQIALLFQILLGGGIILWTLYVLLPFFGIPQEIYLHALKTLFTGFNLGEIKISLTAVIFSLMTFFICIQLFKGFQNVLKRHVFVYMDIDSGVQNSITTGIGYLGGIIAIILSASVLGVSFKNLAVIIGALSVGIGFGLQNIVNNFMSGLIILIERPLKVGDWVIIKENEGIVKKINIRSTELETFDKASLIIPNAEILTNPLTNWTHQNLNARLIVKVSVAYGTDLQKAKKILLDAASQDDRIMKIPEPYVVFQEFGDNGLELELRCVLSFLMEKLSVGTQLRENIYRGFNEAGIEIPFPQRVLHIETDDSKAPRKSLLLKEDETK